MVVISPVSHINCAQKVIYRWKIQENELWKIMVKLSDKANQTDSCHARRADNGWDIRGFRYIRLIEAGQLLSNLLCNIALKGADRRSGVQRNGILITKSHRLLGFADDIDIKSSFHSNGKLRGLNWPSTVPRPNIWLLAMRADVQVKMFCCCW